MRNQLLESLIKEELGHVQRKIANTVAAHATLSPWPALMKGIVQLSSSATIKHHALCLFLLDKLAENIGSVLISNLDHIMRIILPFLLENNELNNRILGAQALCSVLFEVQTITPNLCDSLQLLPPIILRAVAQQEDLLLQDMLQNMSRLSNEKPELFISSWNLLFQSIQTLCESEEIEGGSKVCALQIMITLITSNKSSFCSVESSRRECLRLCIRLMTAVDEDDEAVCSHTRPESEGELFPILSFPFLPYPSLSFPILSFRILPYPSLSFPILLILSLTVPLLPILSLSFPMSSFF